MSSIIWTTETRVVPTRLPVGTLVRKLAWWGGAATGAILTNTALLFALLYWFSVFE